MHEVAFVNFCGSKANLAPRIIKMLPKKRSYKEAFLNFGFMSVIENSIEKP